MKFVQDVTAQLIRDGGFSAVWSADLMYNDQRLMQDITVNPPKLSWDLGRFVVSSGSTEVTHSDAFGRSIIPRQIGDIFAPFGSELQIDVVITAGSYRDRIPMTRVIIESVGETDDRQMMFQGVSFTPGETLPLTVADRLAKVKRDSFLVPTAARSRSAWQEIQAITRMPVIRSLPDAAVPEGMAYEGAKDAVVSKLFDLMGGWPHLTADGVLTGISKAWGAPVGEIIAIESAPMSMDPEPTYNSVVVEGKSAEGDPIFATAEITEGFLRVVNGDGSISPFGSKPLRYQNDGLTTYEQCAAYAKALLGRVSRVRGVRRNVTTRFNPLLEVGDVMSMGDSIVRIMTLSHDGVHTQMSVESPD